MEAKHKKVVDEYVMKAIKLNKNDLGPKDFDKAFLKRFKEVNDIYNEKHIGKEIKESVKRLNNKVKNGKNKK